MQILGINGQSTCSYSDLNWGDVISVGKECVVGAAVHTHTHTHTTYETGDATNQTCATAESHLDITDNDNQRLDDYRSLDA